MPYSVPSPVHDHHDLPPIKLRPKHRRTRSAFPDVTSQPADDRPHIPRRRGTRPLFHFTDDDNDDDHDNDHDNDDAEDTHHTTPGLTIDTSPASLQVPFPSQLSPSRSPSPTQSGHLSPQHFSHSAPSLVRSPSSSTECISSPIIYLANGKPLKPSLKSCHSSPHIPSVRVHTRAQSEPSTPAVKNVHFPEQDDALKSVRLFDKSGKPASLSRVAGEETETETEYDSSSQQPGPSSHPFPTPVVFELDSSSTSQIPPPHYIPSAESNIHLETLVLPASRPLVLRGTVLVRNIAFSKDLAIRFTLDDWQTTSEVGCRHVVSLPGLPPPFAPPNTPPRHTLGDLAGVLAYRSQRTLSQAEWDRFSFSINLEDVERKLDTKTLWLVIRYTVPGHGEWWDNNEGSNYRVGFKVGVDKEREMSKEKEQREAAREMTSAHSQQRSFNAPLTLRTTPMSGNVTVARAPPLMRSHSSPQPATVAVRHANAAGAHGGSNGSSWTLPSRLSLLNYSAPSKPGKVLPPHLSESDATKDSSMGQIATPPTTPPQAGVRVLMDEMDRQTGKGFASVHEEHVGAGEKAGKGSNGSSPTTPRMKMVMVGGMPASVLSNSPSQSPNASGSEKERDSDGERAKKGSGMGFASTRPVPMRRTSPPSYFTGVHNANGNGNGNANTYAGASVSSGATSPLPTDSSYAAFVKHWCFVQSPTPSPSIASPTPIDATNAATLTLPPTNSAVNGPSVASSVQQQRNHSRASSGGASAHPWFLNGGVLSNGHGHGHGHHGPGDALGLYYPRSDSPMLAGM